MSSTKIKKLLASLFSFILFSSLSSSFLFGDSQYGSNYSPVNIPDYDGWVYSSIYISGAPADAVVSSIDVTFSCTHPWAADLNIDINDDGQTRNYDLWQNESGTNPYRTRTNITTFNGLPVNGIWDLWARDCAPGDEGRIDWWTITIYYTINQQSYTVNALIYNPVYGTDADGDGYYETFSFYIGIDGNVSSGSATIYAKMICTTTGQSWWSASPWTISGTASDYHYFPFDETNFTGYISGNSNLDFIVELWNSTKTTPLAATTRVTGGPIKADNYIPPSYSVYGKIDNFVSGTDVDGDNYYETFTFWMGFDGDVSPGSATIYAKMICNTTGQAWWSQSSWSISGDDTDYHYFEFDEKFFSDYLSVHGNTDLDFTVEIWDSTKSTKLAFNENVSGEPIKADYFSGPPATVTVHGKMEYLDRYNNRHPIRYAKIEVFDYNTVAPIGTSTTNGDGEYSITVNNDDPNDESAADIIVKVLPEGTAGAYPGTNSTIGIVKDPQLTMPWHMMSQTYNDNLKSDLEINLTVSNSSDNAGAFSVYDAIVEAFIKAYSIYGQEMPVITVKWQAGDTGYISNEIYLLTLDRWDRDVILHEYGHFIQDIMGFQNGPVGNNDHSWDVDLRYYPTSRTDAEAMNLAFREAWPTFFSISVQYGDNSFPNSGDSIYQDTEDAIPDIKDDLEQDTRLHFSPGEFYESMNCCALWDIFDSQNHPFDNNDTLNLGHDEIWNVVRNDKPNKIDDFWNYWFNSHTFNREMTRIFLDHRMSFIAQAPKNPSPSDGSPNQPLSLTLDWDDAQNATSYDVYFGKTGNLQKVGNTNNSAYPIANLEYSTAYQWQIIARDGRAEAESPIWSFQTLMEHKVSAPNVPSGPSFGDKNISFNYSTSGAFCSYGHILQYRFDWGDGTFSDWSTLNTASHTWAEYGTYTVKAQARCAYDVNIISSLSTGKLVTIEKPHFVTTPSIPDGNKNYLENILYTFYTGGSSCSHDHNVEYRFDWGDGTLSNWTGVIPGDSHAWNAPGTYTVKAQARCASNPDLVSGFSHGFMVNVSETHSLSVQSGIITGIPVPTSPNDLTNSGNGNTHFTRIYNPGTVVTLTASPTYNNNDFVKWVIDGIEDINQTVQINMDQDHIAMLYYYIPQEPEIKIKDGPLDGKELSNESSYDFGNLKINFYEEVLWLVVNEGVIDLELPGSPPTIIEGQDSDQFIVSQQPWSVMAPGEGSSFIIRFAPTTEGTKYAKISIANNDTNENPYEINLIGTGLPEVGIPLVQREALIALYNSTNGDNWTNNSGWKDGELEPDGFAARGTENTWYGVFCSYENTVTSINLSDNNLVGTIPPELGNIKDLEFLHLSNNHLDGNIPVELGNVTDLFSLLINGNKLKGSLPTSLANLIRLGQTNIGYNLLYTDDDNLRSFLNDKDPDWESTQTTTPTGLTAIDQSNFYIEINWNPIQYTSNTGGYRVFYSTTPGGPYTFFDSTSDKTITAMKVTGLSPGIIYYFVVQTRTEPNGFNQNILDSDCSEELASSTTAVSAINVTSPNGGESWQVNSVQNITWNSYGLSGNIKIEYSSDDGNTWKLVTSSTENDGSYPWLIPYDVSSQCKIRLCYEGTPFVDTSDEVFSIVLPLQLIMVTSPNGGETWHAGSTPYINWTTYGPLGTLIIEYSTDNGANWNLIDYINENDGSHPWTIPVVESLLCLVRISQMGGSPADTSDAVFTIVNEIPSITVTSPTSGDNWPARSYREIKWNSNNVDGNVKIEYSTNGGLSWKDIVSSTENDGIYSWSVPNDPSALCYIRISEIDGAPSDQSDWFEIDSLPSPRISEIERMALIDLYNSTNGDSWKNNSGWKTPPLDTDGFAMPGTEYTWYGVNVVAYWDVQGLSLSNNNLAGFIPNSIGNLSQLVSLNLSWNKITQGIPQSIGNLQNLLFLYLNANQLTGAIPSTLGTLSNLAYIYLDNNQLSGTIPVELENLSNLITLSLCINNFSGEIPTWLGNLPELKYLYLFRNSFTGSIPSSLGNISDLRTLWLSNNYLTGSIPEDLGNLTNLWSLDLHSNQLEDSIPASLGNLLNLQSLTLYDNRLSGNIPEELGNLSNLNTLYLQSNILSGCVPLTLTNLIKLGSSSTDIGYDALYTNDETLRIFLNGTDPDWETTQTVAPADVSAAALSGDSIQLNWTPITYIGDTGGYQVYFSMTSGGPYSLYDTTTDKTISSMIVTGLDPGTTYYFKVQSVTDPHVNNKNSVISEESSEVSAATLSLFYIQVTSPNGGENYEVGALQNITWITVGPVGDVKIEYSTDNGSTWVQIVGATLNDGIHSWTIPDNTSPNCLVKISEANGSLADTSNNTFSIVPVPSINITFPDGGVSFEVGSLQNITWSSLGAVGNVRIEYSTDNGSSWIDIVSSTPNDGLYSWTIPDSISSQCLIRISEIDGNPAKTSAVFSIVPQPSLSLAYPNGGENLEARSKQGVTWSSIGSIESVKLEYSTDNGSNWTEITPSTENDGFNLWQIPDSVSSQCLLKISEASGSLADTSDSLFSIIPEPTITIISSDGGDIFEVGSTQNIIWSTIGTVGNVRIEYSIDNGAQWSEIVSSTENDYSYEWTIPDTVSSQCLVRISEIDGDPVDTSMEIFSIVPGPSIIVESPNGGEDVEVGSIQNINWSTTGTVGNIRIEYSTDNGANWIEIVSSTENNMSYLWTIPDTVSSQCKVRVSEIDGNPSDTSDDIFSIVSIPSITVISPDGGEKFEVGSSQNINWSTTGIVGNIKIEYSTNNGASWIDIITSTENDGIYTWVIPNAISSQCLIKISEPGKELSDTSDNTFLIVPVPLLPEIERNALVDLYNNTNGDNWAENSGWKIPPLHTDGFAMPGTEESWAGITIDNSHVIKIELINNNLSGSMPASISNFSNLQLLNISQNQLTGNIPSSFGNFSNLKFLYIQSNQLTGSIPPELGNMANLVGLYLSNNELSSNIPSEIGNISGLLYLEIQGNQLSGIIPQEFGNLLNLQILKINSNKLSGRIPIDLKNLTGLSNSDTDIGYNGLYTDDADLLGFLSIKDPDWADTQTIAPSDVSATALSENSIQLNWTPIPYSTDNGGYLVFYSTDMGGDYTLFDITVDKTISSSVIAELTPNTTYYFLVQTKTEPHENNNNTVISKYSSRCVTSTAPIPVIIVTSPNGGENFRIGSIHDITWSTTGIVGNVKIDYSINNGSDWITIIPSVANIGSYSWTVPNTVSSQCIVKVSEASTGSPSDTSDSIFLIYNGIPVQERSSLIALYNATNGDSWINSSGWKTPPLHTDGFAMPGTESGWYGVIVQADQVIRIELGNNQLTGNIPIELGNLSNLNFLDLSHNHLSGSIPIELGNLSSLENLGLSFNQLSGVIPPQLGNLSNLQYLYLNDDQLSGGIPPELGNLGNLIDLYLYNNQLSGNIPDQLGNLGNLYRLHMFSNQLSGGIPAQLGNLGNLRSLLLYNNQLSGSIPAELGNLSNLQSLYLNDNQLNGTIPPQIGNLNSLKDLGLYNNQFSGTIPTEFGNLSNLSHLYIHSNQLTGSLPPNLINLTNLDDSLTNIGYNGLYTDDESLRTFLNTKDPDWESTQTIAPTDVSAAVVSYNSVEISWTPITYTGNTGGYRVLHSTASGESYTLFNTTINKTVSSMIVTGLTPGTTYYFVVQTRTEPHDNNQNTIDSENSEEVSAVTLLMPGISVISPNGGESWQTGSIHSITWTTTGTINSVTIQYSMDNGNSWITIVYPTVNNGSYSWIVPDKPSDNCLVRIIGGESDDAPFDVSDAVFSIVSAPVKTLKIQSPNGGERLKVGSTHQITWASNGAGGDIKIDYSIDNGASWIPIVPSTPNDGSYPWTVPNTASEDCLVRISECDKDEGIFDISDGGFSIVAAPFITITSPNGGESWDVGSSRLITWTGSGVTGNVKIEFSTNNGSSWTSISASSSNTGSFNWTIPNSPSETCLVRVGESDGSPSDTSNTAFSIVPAPFLTVTSPNGGESWNAGSLHNITWTGSNAGYKVTIDYSPDNGTSWTTIVTSVDNNGCFPWSLPASPSDNCLVRIKSSNADRELSDSSDAKFSIAPAPVITITSPNGGERLNAGTSHNITWSCSGTVGEVKIEFSLDNGSLWTSIVPSTSNDGSHLWTVPENPSKSCRVRISEIDNDPVDICDGVFTIVTPPNASLSVTSPNGGEQLTTGSSHSITWSSTGLQADDPVSIHFSTDNGVSWTSLVPSTPNSGSFPWKIPDLPTENALIRLTSTDSDDGPSDSSDAVFTIVEPSTPTLTITSPNGGESFTAASSHEITWSASGLEKVESIIIEYSNDNGSSWSDIAFSTSDAAGFNWTVPDAPSENCLVRIRFSDSDQGPSDVSDRVFSILSAPTLNVTSPNGGEPWKTGSSYNITWTFKLVTGNIVIDLYRGSSFDLNIATTAVDSGCFNWSIPANFTLADDYKILLHKDNTEDYSDAAFSIVDQEPNQPDFNNDGHVDILWRNFASGNNEVWLMNGSQHSSTASLPALPDLNWRIVGTGDFNRDGKTDILWRNYSSGQNLVWFMDGTTQTGSANLPDLADVNWLIAGTGDFNGDGYFDILWRNPLEGRGQVWFLAGTTLIEYKGILSREGVSWRIAGSGDFNGDYHPDILWRNYSSGCNEAWLMNGTNRIGTTAVLEFTDSSWQIVGTGDFNRDGYRDLLWRNYSSGQNLIWFMDGVTRSGSDYIESRSDPNWHIVGSGE